MENEAIDEFFSVVFGWAIYAWSHIFCCISPLANKMSISLWEWFIDLVIRISIWNSFIFLIILKIAKT